MIELQEETFFKSIGDINFCCIKCKDTFIDSIGFWTKRSKKYREEFIYCSHLPLMAVFCKKCHEKYWPKITELNTRYMKEFHEIVGLENETT